MNKPETKKVLNNMLANAERLLKKTKCKEAYQNYMYIKALRKNYLIQEDGINALTKICTDAGKTINNYKRLSRIVQDYVGETMWQTILEKTYKRCENYDDSERADK